MVIGFTERRQTVSEGEVPGADSFSIVIDVAPSRVSEREHQMLYHLLSTGTTTVVSFVYLGSNFDARFGAYEADPIEQRDVLDPGEPTIRPLITEIRNDFIHEDEECYSIRISPLDIPGLRELFMCNLMDTSDPTENLFFEHMICIEDDDGKHMHDSKFTEGQLSACMVVYNVTHTQCHVHILILCT